MQRRDGPAVRWLAKASLVSGAAYLELYWSRGLWTCDVDQVTGVRVTCAC